MMETVIGMQDSERGLEEIMCRVRRRFIDSPVYPRSEYPTFAMQAIV